MTSISLSVPGKIFSGKPYICELTIKVSHKNHTRDIHSSLFWLKRLSPGRCASLPGVRSSGGFLLGSAPVPFPGSGSASGRVSGSRFHFLPAPILKKKHFVEILFPFFFQNWEMRKWTGGGVIKPFSSVTNLSEMIFNSKNIFHSLINSKNIVYGLISKFN
jgi:hypothetical protein